MSQYYNAGVQSIILLEFLEGQFHKEKHTSKHFMSYWKGVFFASFLSKYVNKNPQGDNHLGGHSGTAALKTIIYIPIRFSVW